MSRILIRKAKKEFIADLNREVTVVKQRNYYVKDLSKDYCTSEGAISKKDLKKKDGSVVKTNQNKEFIIFTAGFSDDFRKIKRSAQIIPLKDVGSIITETGINKNSSVVDAGAGSGALAWFLAHLCKEVVSYEIREDFYKIAMENKGFLKLKNLKIKNKDIFKGIDEKEVDVVILDLPDPWNAVKAVESALKIGGYLVSYSPAVPQVMDFVNLISKNGGFLYIKTIELIERSWDVDGRKVRPKSEGIGHSGFLSFVRKIK